MKSNIFESILKRWRKAGKKPFWEEIATEFGYSSAEAARSDFRRERKRRNIEISGKQSTENTFPKICVFDIETTPLIAYTFGLWEQNIGRSQVISDIKLLSWSAKMLNDSNIMFDILTPDEAIEKDDSRIVHSIWKTLNVCDIVIGHNVKEFDLKKLNVRFLVHGLPPLSNLLIIDTLVIARSNFSFSSNSLKYINQFLGIKQKIENEGFMLWRNCMEGSQEALDKMLEYNIGDVLATEDLYYKVLPFIKGHPNLALYFDTSEELCPKCLGTNLEGNGYYYTPNGKYEAVRCLDCGAIGRRKYNLLSKTKRMNLIN